jgi:preprotein translocase subunit YajC
MRKKLFLWMVYIGFVGMLVFGAINRFNLKAQDNENSALTEGSDHDWITLKGLVTAVNKQSMVIRIEDGSEITITRRVWRYAMENGFIPTVGDQLTLNGFYENGEFEVGVLTNEGSGAMLRTRDKNGVPMWSGNR